MEADQLPSTDIQIALVVAAAENGVIGRGGALPWRMPSDLKLFRRVTLGHPVVMGRKTWQSIGKPLAGRDNIVVTRDAVFRAEGALVVASFEAALREGRRLAGERGVGEIMVIGGAELFRLARPLADRIHLTRIRATVAGDATFADPEPGTWHEIAREALPCGPDDQFAAEYIIYARTRKTA